MFYAALPVSCGSVGSRQPPASRQPEKATEGSLIKSENGMELLAGGHIDPTEDEVVNPAGGTPDDRCFTGFDVNQP